MNIRNDKIMQMQAEMARFENEISGQFMRPPMPRMGGDMALRFIPHALRRGPAVQYPPPPMGLGNPVLNAPSLFHARAPTNPHQSSSAVIEGAPTRYTSPPTANPKISSATFSSSNVPVMPTGPNLEIEAAKKRMAAERAGMPGGSSASSSKQESSKKSKLQQSSSKSLSSTKVIRPKRYIRTAGGESWEDSSLLEWDPNDFRLFCGDLGNEVSDELLAKAFRKYPSFQKAKVIREKRTNKTKGYGFVSFKDPQDFIRALREMDGKYVGNRPIKLRKSTWKDRNIYSVKKKLKEKHKLGLKL